jgi:two-component system LytT family response regulator
MNKLNAVIIEDNQDHIKILKIFLTNFCSEIKVIGEAGTIPDAKEILRNLKPDIIFLDMELGGENSFKIIERLAYLHEAEIIITSSHSKYALKAFEHLVTDYVLKPLKPESLMIAVNRSKKNIELKRSASGKNMQEYTNSSLKQLAIPSIESIEIININKILYLESDGRYTRFYMEDNTTKIASKNLGEYEKLLRNNYFFRIHHSFLVNMNFAVNIQKKDGNYLKLTSHKYLPISKRKITSLYRFLKLK